MLVEETTEAFKEVDQKLKTMKEENEKLHAAGSSELRIRINMHNTFMKKYMDLLLNFRQVQEKYKNMHREKIERHLKVVNPDATQEDIDKVIESGATDVFAQQFVETLHQKEADDALKYVTNKHKEIQRLEQSIQELYQLFVDMAVLVETQGELIDQIEKNVIDARAYTEAGVKQLKAAGKYQKAARKKMCFFLVCGIVVLVVIVAIITGIVSTN